MYKNILALMYAVCILILPADSKTQTPVPANASSEQLIIIADQKNERASVFDLNNLDLTKPPCGSASLANQHAQTSQMQNTAHARCSAM
jgi:hypothetical protein